MTNLDLVPFKLTEAQQRWYDEHTREDTIPKSSHTWMLQATAKGLSRSSLVFPPSCVVVVKVPMGIPGRGKLGYVINYFANGHEVVVRHCDPDDTIDLDGTCGMEDLTIVGYWKGLTPERVKALLAKDQN